MTALSLRAQLETAFALHQQGCFSEAASQYQAVLSIQPDNFNALHMLGVLALQNNNAEQARALIEQAAAIRPDDAEARYNLGIAYTTLQRWDLAIASYQAVIKLNPHHTGAVANLTRLLHDPAAVAKCNDRALVETAFALHQQGHLEIATSLYQAALLIRPDNFNALHMLGVLAIQNNDDKKACTLIEQAVAIRPDDAEARYNLGIAYVALQQWDLAITHYQIAMRINPQHAGAAYNLGCLFKDRQQLVAAVACYDDALRAKPNWADAYWNKSLTLLLGGQFDPGWRLYEWRWQIECLKNSSQRFLEKDLWLGESALAGKTLLLHTEQGMGDSLHFCRYAPLLSRLGAQLVLEVDRPLVTIMQSLDGVARVIEKGQALPAFDYHCPMMSLPLAFKTFSESDIPSQVPYLFAPPNKMRAWHERLGAKSKLRVGVVWSSGVHPEQEPALAIKAARRHLPFSLLAHLNHPDIEFYSLQKGERAESTLVADKKQYWVGNNFHVFTDQLHDFSDTAALIMQLDLIISVCTSVPHLAGALGKTTWLLLPFSADWRWLLDREDSPWYPSLRLFRQPQEGDWESVIAKVGVALTETLKTFAR